MDLIPGARIGPYEVIARLGAGGMGEVYKARDARLDRTVAIKVLSSHLAGDAQFRQRFEREARTLGSLSHPHICPVHDVGSIDGTDYLVMEFLDGETLADRLRAGRMPLDKVLKTAHRDRRRARHRAPCRHRASRCEARQHHAHEERSEARRLWARQGQARDGVGCTGIDAANESPDLTVEGTILGTFQYMAPEQLEGREADARTDIFAIGAVLFEMIAGRRAFTGDTRASVIGAILRDSPPPIAAALPADQKILGPAGVHHLDYTVRRCLAKDPDDRWQSARDVMLQLQWIAEGGPDSGSFAAARARRARQLLPPGSSRASGWRLRWASGWLFSRSATAGGTCASLLDRRAGRSVYSRQRLPSLLLNPPFHRMAGRSRFSRKSAPSRFASGCERSMPWRRAHSRGPRMRHSHSGRQTAACSASSPMAR